MANAAGVESCLRCQGTGIDPVQPPKPRLVAVDGELVASEVSADRCRVCDGNGYIEAQRR